MNRFTKRITASAVAAALALPMAANATNGTNLIGVTAASRAMGGTDIGISRGAGSSLGNPSLITSVEATEVTFGGTLFMPSVKTDGGNPSGEVSSDADTFVVPSMGFATKANDNFYWGIGMYGVSGMGVDYRKDGTYDPTTANAASNMVTNLQVMQMAVPLAYKTKGFSIGVTPLLEYAALDAQTWLDTDSNGSPDTFAGNGTQQVLEFGFNLGLAYTTGGLTIGAVYKSEIELNFKDQLQQARDGLYTAAGGTCTSAGCAGDMILTQPAEIGLGASYVMGPHTFALDWKQIQYKDSKDWGTFGWDNVDVFALGYQYDGGKWTVRAGYNQGSNPISDQSPGPGGSGYGVNYFNLVGFPAIVEQHYTIGGSYDINKQMTLDLAFSYAPEVSQTLNGFVPPATSTQITTKHSQTALGANLNFAF
ncbi:MAG TPA: aromatic hydrocarbon degradation protein [Gammaproteobacteria bacterium]|nr:aromatic hydrocarbon degradation protein [Gammaproteobacteria bacterium]